MKKLLSVVVAVTTCGTLLMGCGGSKTAATTAAAGTAESTTESTAAGDTAAADDVKVSTTFCNMLANDHPQSVAAANVLAKEISEKTNGNFTIDTQFNGALGSDSETVEATIMGNMDMTGPACATLASMDPNWYVLDLPYVFQTKEQAREALDGDLGQYLSDSLEKSNGLICLGFGESGMRNISNNTRAINTPADLSGMKIRVLENKYHIATFEALGANPTPMAFSEVYTALQMNQIDGQDNPITITYTNKFYEVQKYYTIAEQLFCGNCVVVNAAWFHNLPESYQTALRESVHDMIVEQRKLIDENEANYLSEMEKAGCAVNELTTDQKQAFIDATESVRSDFIKEYGDNGQKMIDMANKYVK